MLVVRRHRLTKILLNNMSLMKTQFNSLKALILRLVRLGSAALFLIALGNKSTSYNIKL